jgi:hypothetical protein
MLRIAGALMVALLIATAARAQQINTALSDRQIIANILKECRELYMRGVGACACADERARASPRCYQALKDLPDSFKPFCTRKDVSLREVSMYRMQNFGFIDQRCSK